MCIKPVLVNHHVCTRKKRGRFLDSPMGDRGKKPSAVVWLLFRKSAGSSILCLFAPEKCVEAAHIFEFRYGFCRTTICQDRLRTKMRKTFRKRILIEEDKANGHCLSPAMYVRRATRSRSEIEWPLL